MTTHVLFRRPSRACRRLLVCAAGASVLALSACSVIEPRSVATVGGHPVDRGVVLSLASNEGFLREVGLAVPESAAVADGETVRQVLGVLLQGPVAKAGLDELGGSVNDADRTQVADVVKSASWAKYLSPAELREVRDSETATSALGRVLSELKPDDAMVDRFLERHEGLFEQVCGKAVLVDAKQRSETARLVARKGVGAVTGAQDFCVSAAQLATSPADAVTKVLITLSPGQQAGPIEVAAAGGSGPDRYAFVTATEPTPTSKSERRAAVLQFLQGLTQSGAGGWFQFALQGGVDIDIDPAIGSRAVFDSNAGIVIQPPSGAPTTTTFPSVGSDGSDGTQGDTVPVDGTQGDTVPVDGTQGDTVPVDGTQTGEMPTSTVVGITPAP